MEVLYFFNVFFLSLQHFRPTRLLCFVVPLDADARMDGVIPVACLARRTQLYALSARHPCGHVGRRGSAGEDCRQVYQADASFYRRHERGLFGVFWLGFLKNLFRIVPNFPPSKQNSRDDNYNFFSEYKYSKKFGEVYFPAWFLSPYSSLTNILFTHIYPTGLCLDQFNFIIIFRPRRCLSRRFWSMTRRFFVMIGRWPPPFGGISMRATPSIPYTWRGW